MSALDDARRAAAPDTTSGTTADNQAGKWWYPSEEARYLHAQALATIALAEEQRTANLIAFLPYARDRGWTHISFDQLAQEVENRLGIRPEFAPGDDEPPV